MHDVKDRLEKLLRLATNNPNEEEARSAALKFCKMLVEHGGHFGLEAAPAQPPPIQYAPPTSPYYPTYPQYGYDPTEELRDWIRKQGWQPGKWYEVPKQPK